MNAIHKVGVIHGRFQGLHKGHLEYLLEGKKRCEKLIIGITNYTCNEKSEHISKIDTHRLNPSDNPFTFYERLEMIRVALLAEGINEEEFRIVPFPIEKQDQIFNFVPRDAVFFITIYDNWGREKLKILKTLGLSVEVMWERSLEQKPISGSLLRKKISHGEEWEYLVPTAVASYIKEHNLCKKITNNYKCETNEK